MQFSGGRRTPAIYGNSVGDHRPSAEPVPVFATSQHTVEVPHQPNEAKRKRTTPPRRARRERHSRCGESADHVALARRAVRGPGRFELRASDEADRSQLVRFSSLFRQHRQGNEDAGVNSPTADDTAGVSYAGECDAIRFGAALFSRSSPSAMGGARGRRTPPRAGSSRAPCAPPKHSPPHCRNSTRANRSCRP